MAQHSLIFAQSNGVSISQDFEFTLTDSELEVIQLLISWMKRRDFGSFEISKYNVAGVAKMDIVETKRTRV